MAARNEMGPRNAIAPGNQAAAPRNAVEPQGGIGSRNAKGTTRAVSAYTRLQCAVDSVTALQAHQLASFGLTVSQFALLKSLLLAGPMSVTQIGASIFCTESNASVVASNLAKRGLIVRRLHKADRRCVSVHLTPEGRALVSKVYPMYAKVVRAQMSALTGVEQDRLAELCQKLEKGDAVRFISEITRPDE